MQQLPVEVIKGCPSVGASLYSVCVPSGFGGRVGFDMNTNHTFRQDVLVALNLVGDGAEEGVSRVRSH